MFEWYYSIGLLVIFYALTIISFSAYMHRSIAHRSVEFTPRVVKFFRIWYWIAGMWWPNGFKVWSTIHRKHHSFTDTKQDPHSPWFYLGYNVVFDGGAPGQANYVSPEDIKIYASDIPEHNDQLEKFFSAHPNWGRYFTYLIFLLCFGFGGLILCVVLYSWPKYSSRLFNIVGHKYGYKNYLIDETNCAQNTWTLGLGWMGEDFHNNHHYSPGSAKFSVKWWECDITYGTIKVLEYFGQAKILK